MKDVFLDYGCFASIMSSVIESFPKETYGFVGGEETQKRFYLKMSPPLQSAHVTNKSVEFRDKKRYEQAKNVIDAFGLTIVGGFHSHPEGIPYPSDDDILSAGIENLIKKLDPDSPLTDKWLEIVIGLQREKYKKNFRPTASFDYTTKKIHGKLKIENYGYSFEMIGYWVKVDEISHNEFYPTPEEVANLSIDSKSFPQTWDWK